MTDVEVMTMNDLLVQETDDDLCELGVVSEDTRGAFIGSSNDGAFGVRLP